MYNSKKYIIVILLLFVHVLTVNAQTPTSSNEKGNRIHALVLEGGTGISTYISGIGKPPVGLQGDISKTNLASTFRVMWYPNHRLRLGIETGYTNFYRYKVVNGSNAGKLSLNAVPIIIMWSMPIVKRVNVYAGFGTYLLTSHLDYNGVVNSSTMSLGTSLAVSYTYPLSKKLGLASEIKWMNAAETKDETLSLQMHLVWRFLEWKK
jgi:hypothetical protein